MAIITAALLGALLSACGSSNKNAVPAATTTPFTTSAPQATQTPETGPPVPESARIIEHMRVLSQDIGIRLAGSDAVSAAAEYAQDQFEIWGYDVELQQFSDERPEAVRYAGVVVQQPQEHFLHSISFLGGQSGTISGPLVAAGAGLEEDFPNETRGAIVLIQRGDVLFVDMAARAKAHGAIGMIVANNKAGVFRGEIPPGEMLAAAIRQEAGEELRAQLEQRAVDVTIEVPSSIEGVNVIARPPTGVCRTISGGHYDTVPWAPGAVDNASGSALVLELARAASEAGLSDHCFALFSGEEEGLSGSRQYVADMSQEERDALVAYVNYDVVAGGTQIAVIGDQDLAGRAVAFGEEAGDDILYTQLPSNASSDHASFARANLPNLMITVDDLGVLHTEQDTFDFAREHAEPLQPIANIGFALIQQVLLPAAP